MNNRSKIFFKFLILFIFIQYQFYLQILSASDSSNIKLSNGAIQYLNSIGFDTNNENRINILNLTLSQIKNNNADAIIVNKNDIQYAIFSLLQFQRAYSKFPISLNKKFYDLIPDKQLIAGLDKNFKSKYGGIIFNKDSRNFFVGSNKYCITDNKQNIDLSNVFNSLKAIDSPVGIILDDINNMKAVNIFGETVAKFQTTDINIINKNVITYKVSIENKFVTEEVKSRTIFVSFNLRNCNPNELSDKIEQLSKCNSCKLFLQINNIFFNIAEVIYLFFSKYLLTAIAIVIALRFMYRFGAEHYQNMGQVDYKSMFFTFTRVKLFKIIIFISLLWIHPSFIVRWTVEPITLMGITLSKEILNAGGSVKNKKICKESEIVKKISEDNTTKKEEFISDNNIIFPQTEKLIDGNLGYKKEKDIITSNYTASILCNIYEVRDFISKHQIIGEILSKFAITELFFPSTKTTGGIIQSITASPIFYIGTSVLIPGFGGIFGILSGLISPLIVHYNRTTVLLNLFFFGAFLFISMVLFNFILFLYFIDLCVNLAVAIMKIPLYLIVWIFNDQDQIDLSFSQFFNDIKSNAISIVSISFIVVFMMTFMEYIYYNILDIPVGAIDKAFEYGRADIITNPIISSIASGHSSLNFAFFDIMLVILTFWYISKNMDKLLSILGGSLPGAAIANDIKSKVISLYKKVVNVGINTTTKKIFK